MNDHDQTITIMSHGPHSDGGPETRAYVINRLDLDDKRVLVEVLCTYCGDTAYAMTRRAWLPC